MRVRVRVAASWAIFQVGIGAESPALPHEVVPMPADALLDQEQEELLKESSVNTLMFQTSR